MNQAGIKDKMIFLGWIAGLFIAITLLWGFTRPLQARCLLRAVNRVFMTNGDTLRLSSHLPQTGKNSMLGYWYIVFNSTDRFFVFGLFHDGILVPCGARVSMNGKVDEIIPLGAHSRVFLENVPESIRKMYIERIEASQFPETESNAGSSSAREVSR